MRVDPDQADLLFLATIELGDARDRARRYGVIPAENQRNFAGFESLQNQFGALGAGGGDFLKVLGTGIANFLLFGNGNCDIDAVEKENVRKAGIGVFTMRDIDERGMRAVMEEALRMAGRGTAGYHVSLDMDWIDPEDAPGVGTPVWGGATYREAHLAMEIIADHGRMLSFEIVEVNPVIDERNQTADLAVELALSAFGKKIL